MKKKASLILSIIFMSVVVLVCFPIYANAENESCDHSLSDYESCVKLNDKHHSITGICDKCGETVTLKEKHYAMDYTKAKKLSKRYHMAFYTCEACGASYKHKEKHDWEPWDVVKKATVFKKGKKVRECYDCSAKQTKALKRVKPFAKFKAKKYSVIAGKTLRAKTKIKMGRGDSVKTWMSSNNSIASVSKHGIIIARSKGIVKITAILKSGKKATCTVNVKAKTVPKNPTQEKESSGSGIVYWVPSGSVYHLSRYCSTLSRSKTIYSGTIQQSGKSRCCKVCG